jgi:hypothetical protein
MDAEMKVIALYCDDNSCCWSIYFHVPSLEKQEHEQSFASILFVEYLFFWNVDLL